MTASRDEALDLTARVASGTAELVADPRRTESWTLLVDGVAQSYVDLRDPLRLEMMYVRMVAAVIDAAAAPGEPLRVLHLGGGGMTLPRYVAASRPASPQLVVDGDRRLLELVQFGLPLPPGAGIIVQYGDARAAVESGSCDSFDLIINDVYRGAAMPRRVAGTGFVAEAARLLAPGGLYVANVLDAAGLVGSKRQLATVRTAFADTCVLSTPAMWKGRRDGNVVIVAATAGLALPLDAIAAAARPPPDAEPQTRRRPEALPVGHRAGDGVTRSVGYPALRNVPHDVTLSWHTRWYGYDDDKSRYQNP